MGKGDRPRPIRDRERYDRNWERIFGDGGCHEIGTDMDKCPENVTPDPDINPASWEDKQDE